MAVIEGTDVIKAAVAEYDFAKHGGAIGTITLTGAGALGAGVPNGAIITGGYLEVLTAVTSGGAATLAVTLESANDIVNAAAVGGAPWSTTGRKDIIPAGTGSTSVKATTGTRSIKAVVAAFALTAGKFRVVLFYR